MNTDLSTALSLLAVGMITVFVVLFLVYLVGNLLIRFVNSYTPEVLPVEKPIDGSMSTSTVAAITAAVEAYTAGRGRITKIEKEN